MHQLLSHDSRKIDSAKSADVNHETVRKRLEKDRKEKHHRSMRLEQQLMKKRLENEEIAAQLDHAVPDSRNSQSSAQGDPLKCDVTRSACRFTTTAIGVVVLKGYGRRRHD